MFRMLMIGYIALPALAVIGAARSGSTVPTAAGQLVSTPASTCPCGECEMGCGCCDEDICVCSECVCSGCQSQSYGSGAASLVSAESETPACCMMRKFSVVAATDCCASGVCDDSAGLMADAATRPASAVALASTTTDDLAEVAEITADAESADCDCGQCDDGCGCCDDADCSCEACVCDLCTTE